MTAGQRKEEGKVNTRVGREVTTGRRKEEGRVSTGEGKEVTAGRREAPYERCAGERISGDSHG